MATDEQTQAVRDALASRLGEQRVDHIIDGIAVDNFLSVSGQVDADRVDRFASAAGAGGPRGSRDFGAGHRSTQPPPQPSEAERRFGPRATPDNTDDQSPTYKHPEAQRRYGHKPARRQPHGHQ